MTDYDDRDRRVIAMIRSYVGGRRAAFLAARRIADETGWTDSHGRRRPPRSLLIAAEDPELTRLVIEAGDVEMHRITPTHSKK
jgi:hypothetical protein